MEDELRLNTKLYGFDGIIGRRDYFLNGIIICSIALFATIPCNFWLFANIGSMSDFFSLNKVFAQAPFLLKLWCVGGMLAVYVLSASNMWRRLNDINGKIVKPLNWFVVLLFLPGSIFVLLPTGFCIIMFLLSLIAGLILLFRRGKITGNYPYDFTKEFNWGAFLGTWIWGLFNKSFKTLWAIPLGFTPWAIYYQLYCGLRGNEWAFKNKKWNDVEAFNKSQEKQSIIFAILFFVIVPILWFVLIFGIISLAMFAAVGDIKDNPQKVEQRMEKIEDGLNTFGSIYFEKSEITPNENKYYVKSSDWNIYSFKDKKDILDLAASMASNERRKEYKKQNPKGYKSFSKTEELPRTKIYSVETNRLLGEFILDESAYDTNSVKEIIKAGMNAYKFYKDK